MMRRGLAGNGEHEVKGSLAVEKKVEQSSG
jgi:hypothetical protein